MKYKPVKKKWKKTENKGEIASREIAILSSKIENLDYQKLNSIKKAIAKKHNAKEIMTNIKILTSLSEKEIKKYKKFLITKPTRTGSGVAVVAIMAKPFSCPHGKCIFCPGGIKSSFGTVPQSYTGREPATMRAIRNNYDPYLQVMNRLEQYIVIGQSPEKIELIIMGGTFPCLPKKYKESFVQQSFKAMNDFSEMFYRKSRTGTELDVVNFKKFFELPGNVSDKGRTRRIISKLLKQKKKKKSSLEQEQKKNEKSAIRCVGLTIETRPDWGKRKTGIELLKYGATRVELGIQTPYGFALKKINRGHTLKDSIESIQQLKDLGFKLNFHIMPGLPGVNMKKDIEGLKLMFSDQRFRPDMVKIYPAMIFPGTKIYEDFQKKKFKPITTSQAVKVISEFKRITPKYCRIMRLQRDIPSALGKGVDRNNLRQYVKAYMNKKSWACNCIRCREIKEKTIKNPVSLEVISYKASKGNEFFISLNDAEDKIVGFARMRFPYQLLRKEITKKTALIRELHVYGTSVSIGKKTKGKAQHKGYGSILMAEAEKIAKKHGKNKIVVISGVGVREYYKKLGYSKQGHYMVKIFK